MKSERIEEKTERKAEYPCLMEGDSGSVYLMTSKNTGTRVWDDMGLPVGLHGEGWLASVTKPFNGTIKLTNG